jgi:hypothetical protein
LPFTFYLIIMGKTKTAFVEGSENAPSGEEKYKQRQLKKAQEQVKAQSAKPNVGEKEKKEKIRIPGMGGGQRIKAVTTDITAGNDRN